MSWVSKVLQMKHTKVTELDLKNERNWTTLAEMTDVLQWFIFNWVQNSLFRRIILKISREKLATVLLSSKKISHYQYQPCHAWLVYVDLYWLSKSVNTAG